MSPREPAQVSPPCLDSVPVDECPVRYLMVSNRVVPELVEYPEDGTIRALTRGRFDPPKADEDQPTA
jgi:hypothetical protein